MNIEQFRAVVRSVPCPACRAAEYETCFQLDAKGRPLPKPIGFVHDDRALAWHEAKATEVRYEWGTRTPSGNVCEWPHEEGARRAYEASKRFPDGEHLVVRRSVGDWEEAG